MREGQKFRLYNQGTCDRAKRSLRGALFAEPEQGFARTWSLFNHLETRELNVFKWKAVHMYGEDFVRSY